MKKIISSLMLISMVVLSLVGCSEKVSNNLTTENEVTTTTNNNKIKQDKSTIAIPDSILFYNKGKIITINKDDIKFNDIVAITKDRTKTIRDQIKSAFPIDELKSKGTLLEFTYSNPNSFEYVTESGENRTIIYRKLYFDLNKSDSISNQMSFDGQGYGPVGPLSSVDELMNILSN